MIDSLLASLAPHLCFGCGEIGTVLCESCKENIASEPSERCIVCEQLAGHYLCKAHADAIQQGWYVAQRTGALERLIDAYKFENTKSAYRSLADLLALRLPYLPADTVIVPIPTVSRHVRQRGYDHMALIARYLARRRGLKTASLLRRQTATTQREASRRQRERQAREAFYVSAPLDPAVPYLIIDDVATTGATLRWAARALRDAGAETVYVAAVARQPLD